ncbi:MAG: o-succinylbenzoate synthase, partial [Halobacteriaceae archaeon]
MWDALAAAVRPFSLPLAAPLSTASGTIARREGALFLAGSVADAESDPRDRGVGEAAPLPGWTEGLPACHAALG